MQLPAILFQKLSPFDCCKQSLNIQKQLNLYQINLAQPLSIKSYNKTQSILKIYQLNDFYQKKQTQGYKIIAKSKYQQYKNKCQQKWQIFTDKQFIPSYKSLGHILIDQKVNNKKIIWRRLSQIYDINKISIINPNYINSKQHYFESSKYQIPSSTSISIPIYQQLNISDFILSNNKNTKFTSIISQFYYNKPQIIQEIFNYCTEISTCGLYKLVLNGNGYPKQVIIDDYIPVYQNTSKHVFSKIFKNGQIWHILLEKALAKIFGSYSNLQNVKIDRIMKCLTLAPSIRYEIQEGENEKKKYKIWNQLNEAIKNKNIVFGFTNKQIKFNDIEPQFCYNIVCVKQNSQINNNEITLQCTQLVNQQQSIYSSNTHIRALISPKLNHNSLLTLNMTFAIFLKTFSQFTICYYSKNSNYEFQTSSIANRNALFYNLKIYQTSDVFLTFSRLQRIHKKYDSFSNIFDFSYLQNIVKNIIQINGGWLKLLIARRSEEDNQVSFEYIDSFSQTVDNQLVVSLKLQKGDYIVYLQGYSQQNVIQNYVFSTYCQSRVQLKRIKNFYSIQNPQTNIKLSSHINQYFLQEVMLNYCLTKITNRNYIGENSQWYSSHLLYQKGGFGFVIVYLPKNSNKIIKITYNLQQIKQEGYKIECKNVKQYSRVIKAGEAEVLVLSLDYQAKKYMQKIDFPPKSINIHIIQ